MRESSLDRLVAGALEPTDGEAGGLGDDEDDDQADEQDGEDGLNSRQTLRKLLRIAARSQEVPSQDTLALDLRPSLGLTPTPPHVATLTPFFRRGSSHPLLAFPLLILPAPMVTPT